MTSARANAATAKPVILYLSGFSEIIGGGQISLMLLLKFLDHESFSPAIVFPQEGGYSRFLSPLDCKHFFLQPPKLRPHKIIAIFSYLLALRRLCKKERIAVMHCDTPDVALLVGAARLFSSVKLVFHARVNDSGGLADILLQFLCDRIICVSKIVTRRFNIFPGKCRVIYNGADTDTFTPGGEPALRRTHAIPDDTLVVGYCGQIVQEKGLSVLVEAFKLVRADFPKTCLLLCGRGSYLPLLQAQHIEGLVYAGFMEDVRPFYAATDIFVLPTIDNEGFSRVLVESMACGIPAIATTVGGNPESIEDGVSGFMIPPENPAALAEKLKILLSDQQKRAAMGKAARERVVANFGARSTAAQVGVLYAELCGGKV